MKSKTLWIPLTLALTGFGLKTQDANELEARVEALETELAEVTEYLQAQAKGAEGFEEALDASEEAGFTWGINPESREILLKAMRDHTATIRKDVPGSPTSKDGERPGRR